MAEVGLVGPFLLKNNFLNQNQSPYLHLPLDLARRDAAIILEQNSKASGSNFEQI